MIIKHELGTYYVSGIVLSALHVLTHLMHTTLNSVYYVYTQHSNSNSNPSLCYWPESKVNTWAGGATRIQETVISALYHWTYRCSFQQDAELAWLLISFPQDGFQRNHKRKTPGKGENTLRKPGVMGLVCAGLDLGQEAASLACGRINWEGDHWFPWLAMALK